ncbi:hypothetical protein CPB84DRAFT_128467 [Gymnopilus junonius]|uniref:C2H2-type domain-containing protein n=1 Tax=Gymnopilus junonius TaxID=109634 RepID=A0A9P5TIN8_GYMJU|nr:hypothetical protein CPB84DRAFT_128467 [Gymnopilus junonius]
MDFSQLDQFINWDPTHFDNTPTAPSNVGVNQGGIAPASAAPVAPSSLQLLSKDGFYYNNPQHGTRSSTLEGVPPGKENHPPHVYMPIPDGPTSKRNGYTAGPPTTNYHNYRAFRWPTATGITQVGFNPQLDPAHPLSPWKVGVAPGIGVNDAQLQHHRLPDHLYRRLVRDVPYGIGHGNVLVGHHQSHQNQQHQQHQQHYETVDPAQLQIGASSSSAPPGNENRYHGHHQTSRPLQASCSLVPPTESNHHHTNPQNLYIPQTFYPPPSHGFTPGNDGQAQHSSMFPPVQSAPQFSSLLGDDMFPSNSTTAHPSTPFHDVNLDISDYLTTMPQLQAPAPEPEATSNWEPAAVIDADLDSSNVNVNVGDSNIAGLSSALITPPPSTPGSPRRTSGRSHNHNRSPRRNRPSRIIICHFGPCGLSFDGLDAFEAHLKDDGPLGHKLPKTRAKNPEMYTCLWPMCGEILTSSSVVNHAMRYIHTGVSIECEYCPKTFARKDMLNTHVRKVHPQAGVLDGDVRVEPVVQPLPAAVGPCRRGRRSLESKRPY